MKATLEESGKRKSMAGWVAGIGIAALLAGGVGTAALAATVTWGVHQYQQTAEQQAMSHVLQERVAVKAAALARQQHYAPLSANLDRMTSDLLRIDLTGCPQDFQQAFLANVDAWGKATTEVKGELGLSGLARILGEARTLDGKSFSDDVKGIRAAEFSLRLSSTALLQCARNHGVLVQS